MEYSSIKSIPFKLCSFVTDTTAIPDTRRRLVGIASMAIVVFLSCFQYHGYNHKAYLGIGESILLDIEPNFVSTLCGALLIIPLWVRNKNIVSPYNINYMSS